MFCYVLLCQVVYFCAAGSLHFYEYPCWFIHPSCQYLSPFSERQYIDFCLTLHLRLIRTLLSCLYILQLSNVSQADYRCGSVGTVDAPRPPTYNCRIWNNNLLQLANQFSLSFPKYASYLWFNQKFKFSVLALQSPVSWPACPHG